jgi:hypothetical protein
MTEETKCKGCGKPGAKWCHACYYEYHESKAELMDDREPEYEPEDEDRES